MEEQDLEPRTKRKKLKDLEVMSIEALQGRKLPPKWITAALPRMFSRNR
jgi:hypothetical protein